MRLSVNVGHVWQSSESSDEPSVRLSGTKCLLLCSKTPEYHKEPLYRTRSDPSATFLSPPNTQKVGVTPHRRGAHEDNNKKRCCGRLKSRYFISKHSLFGFFGNEPSFSPFVVFTLEELIPNATVYTFYSQFF